ncbi:hypothetical protein [Streptomyces noursei]|uniref:hypothetical protein n=1 Tax=Streptomyces noursei TaxID=1971 RepID=UPI0030B80F0B
MSPLGVSLAGIGAGLSGLMPAYPLVFALLLAGLDVAMFHPPAGRGTRRAAGGSATTMSYFAAGSSVGFSVGPALATPALDNLRIGTTALFIPPAVLMGFVLPRHHGRTANTAARKVRQHGRERASHWAGLALPLELGGGVLGTLMGGRNADRIGMVRTVKIGNAAMLPALWIPWPVATSTLHSPWYCSSA